MEVDDVVKTINMRDPGAKVLLLQALMSDLNNEVMLGQALKAMGGIDGEGYVAVEGVILSPAEGNGTWQALLRQYLRGEQLVYLLAPIGMGLGAVGVIELGEPSVRHSPSMVEYMEWDRKDFKKWCMNKKVLKDSEEWRRKFKKGACHDR